MRIRPPAQTPLLLLSWGEDPGLVRAWVNGVLAYDHAIVSKHRDRPPALYLVNPGEDSLQVELLTRVRAPLSLYVTTWHELPPVLTAPFMGNWPDEAKPYLFGRRAELIQQFELEIRQTTELPPSSP